MTQRRTPFAVSLLSATLFIVTTSEFQVAALMRAMSTDLNIPESQLGFLVSAYSAGMGLGGPLIAVTLSRVSARLGLPAILGLYAIAEAAAGIVTGLPWLVSLRALTGALSGAVFGMSIAGATALGEANQRGKYTATVLLGLMAGTFAGLPLSRLLGEALGWRASFFVLAGAAALTAALVALTLPAFKGQDRSVTGGTRVLIDLRLWVRYLVSFLTIGGAFTVFAFIDPLLASADVTGVASAGVMVIFGLAAVTVNVLGGRVEPGRARRWLLIALVVQLVALVVLRASLGNPLFTVIGIVMVGGTGMALNPLLVNRVLEVAPPAVLVNTVHTSAITLGVAAATALGSVAISERNGLAGPMIVGIGFTIAALGLSACIASPQRN